MLFEKGMGMGMGETCEECRRCFAGFISFTQPTSGSLSDSPSHDMDVPPSPASSTRRSSSRISVLTILDARTDGKPRPRPQNVDGTLHKFHAMTFFVRSPEHPSLRKFIAGSRDIGIKEISTTRLPIALSPLRKFEPLTSLVELRGSDTSH